MPGLGTIINVCCIVAGGLVGLVGKRFISQQLQDALLKACGLSVIFLGLGGALEKMLTVATAADGTVATAADGTVVLSSGGTMMILVSLAAGSAIGEAIDLNARFEALGSWLREKTGSSGDAAFVDGFVTASLTVCIGAMAIVGSIQDGLTGDSSVLVTKAILDCIIIFVMTASMGKGCIFSALPVFLLQGSVTLLAAAIAPIITQEALDNISLVGDGLILCVGVNTMFHQKIKVANLLPALIFAAAWAYLPF